MSYVPEVEKKYHSPIVMWGLLVIFCIYQFIARSAFPTVLNEEYMKYFCLDAKGVGALVSCYYIIYTFVQIPAGIIMDRFNLRLISALAIIICATGVLIFVSTQNVFIASIGQMLVGLGSAFSFLMVFKVSIDLFPPERRAVMMNLGISISCLGPVVFGPLVAIVVRTFDWRNVMITYTFIGYLLAGFIWYLMGDGSRHENSTENSQQIGIIQLLKILLSSPQAWIFAIFALMQYSPLSALADLWGTSYIKKLYNADIAVSSFANNMIYLGMIVGGPLFSYFAVYIDSYKKTMLLSSTGCAIVFAVVLFSGHYFPLYGMFALFFLIGFFSSAMLHIPLAVILLPREVRGALSGFINMGSMVSGVILMPLIGYLLDFSWNGTIENGIKVYSLTDFRFGLSSVFIALLLGVLSVFFMKDKSPKSAE